MEAITLAVYDISGKEVDTLKLDGAVFNSEVNADAIHQVINAYRANQRKGLASTKTRGEVSGGGKKPWKQKGTGRARVGSTRSPLWKHGGVVFGPHPRDFSINVPQKIKNIALKSALSSKVKENNIIVLDKISLEKIKTKEAAKILSNLHLDTLLKKGKGVLLVADSIDKNITLSLRNVNALTLNSASFINTYEVLNAHKLIITKGSVKQLTDRLKNNK